MGSKVYPEKLAEDFLKGKLDRRAFLSLFLKTVAGASVATALGCVKTLSFNPVLNSEKSITLRATLNHLFPKGDGVPSASDIDAVNYFNLVILDQNIEASDRQLLVDGLSWLDEECMDDFRQPFVNLSKQQQYSQIEKISELGWGENWLSRCITYLFEALLADPIYGGNKDELGWKWLEHSVGVPRPSASNTYTKLLS